MSQVTYGVSGRWDASDQARPIEQANFSVPGAVGICQNLPGGTEPHRCYTVNTNDSTLADKIGEGDLLDHIRQIGAGLPDGVNSLAVTVVPVPDSTEADPATKQAENLAAIAGQSDQKTGVFAFKSAIAQGARLPRLNTIAGLYDAITDGSTANQAVLNLATVNASTYAHAFINGPNSTEAAATAARSLYNEKSLTMIETGAKVPDGAGGLNTVGASGFVVGLQAAVDFEKGGIPSHVAGNRALRIAAPGREMDYAWNDPATEGQRLLSDQIGIIARGEAGGDFAVADGGMMLVVADTLSSEPLERFYNVVRMQNFILVNIMRTYRTFIQKYNMEPPVLEAVIKTANRWLGGLADRKVIYKAPRIRFQADADSPEDWRLGALVLDGYAEPRSPLARIDLTMHRDDTGIRLEIAELEAFAQNLNL